MKNRRNITYVFICICCAFFFSSCSAQKNIIPLCNGVSVTASFQSKVIPGSFYILALDRIKEYEYGFNSFSEKVAERLESMGFYPVARSVPSDYIFMFDYGKISGTDNSKTGTKYVVMDIVSSSDTDKKLFEGTAVSSSCQFAEMSDCLVKALFKNLGRKKIPSE